MFQKYLSTLKTIWSNYEQLTWQTNTHMNTHKNWGSICPKYYIELQTRFEMEYSSGCDANSLLQSFWCFRWTEGWGKDQRLAPKLDVCETRKGLLPLSTWLFNHPRQCCPSLRPGRSWWVGGSTFQAHCLLLTPVLLLQHALFLAARDIAVAGMAWNESFGKDEYYLFSSDRNPVITAFHFWPLGKFRAQENERGNLIWSGNIVVPRTFTPAPALKTVIAVRKLSVGAPVYHIGCGLQDFK